MKPTTSRDKIHSYCNSIVDGGIVPQLGRRRRKAKTEEAVQPAAPVVTESVKTDKRYYENIAFTRNGFYAQKIRDGAERAIRVIVLARRGLRKVVVQDYEIVVPSRRT